MLKKLRAKRTLESARGSSRRHVLGFFFSAKEWSRPRGTLSILRIPGTLHNRMEGLTSVTGVRTPTGQDQGRTGGRYYHR